MQSVSQWRRRKGGTSALHPRPVGNKQAWPPSTARPPGGGSSLSTWKEEGKDRGVIT